MKGPAWADFDTDFEPLKQYHGGLSFYRKDFSPICIPPEIARMFERKALLSPFSNPEIKYAVEILADQFLDPNLGIGLHPDTFDELTDFTHPKYMDFKTALMTEDNEFISVKEGKLEYVDILLRPISEHLVKTFDRVYQEFFIDEIKRKNKKIGISKE
ncbi:MAG: hypothetical protein ACXQS8_09655 [Candidatus Helarchaeales archaeon]